MYKIYINKIDKSIKVVGNRGSLVRKFTGKDVSFIKEGVFIRSKSSMKQFRSMIHKMCRSVDYGYFVDLYLEGRGYRLLRFGDKIYFKFSSTNYKSLTIPKGIKVFGFRQRLVLFGLEEEKVKLLGNIIRQLKRVEAYKGKGVRLVGEELILKIGKQK